MHEVQGHALLGAAIDSIIRISLQAKVSLPDFRQSPLRCEILPFEQNLFGKKKIRCGAAFSHERRCQLTAANGFDKVGSRRLADLRRVDTNDPNLLDRVADELEQLDTIGCVELLGRV